jgi:signal transduction histidine kinase
LILGAALFLSEFGVMFLMTRLPALEPWIHNSLDAALMLLLAFPALYGLVLRPLHRHIHDRQRAEMALQEANATLEQRAADQRFLEKQVLNIMETERQRVGRDLHDSLGGKLTGVALMGKALAQRLANPAPADAELAEEIDGCINECIAQTRSIARGLCPVDLSFAGLVSALRELASETQRHSGVACRLEAEADLPVADPFATSHLFRIAQEAVGNAIRHGRPRQIAISLGPRNEQLCLEIRDDGAGLSETAQGSPGLGLRTMVYRADLIGGALTVKADEPRGTKVTCLLPLAGSTAREEGGRL